MSRWELQKRQEWITARMRAMGYLIRKDIMNAFGISQAQASYDISEWKRANPGKMFYNPSRKRYERADIYLKYLEDVQTYTEVYKEFKKYDPKP